MIKPSLVFKFLTGMGVILVGMELLLRWIPGYNSPALPAPYLVPDPVVEYRLRPSWSNPSGTILINKEGFRGKDIKTQNLQKTILIVGIGGGSTFGRAVTANDKAWPNRLGILYKKHLPERNIQVVNAGVPGRRLLFNLIDLEKKIVAMNPDFVLFSADLDHLTTSFVSQPAPRQQRWSVLLSGIIARLFPPSPPAVQDHWPVEATATLRRHLVSLAGLCQIRHIRTVFSNIPNTHQIIRFIKGNNQAITKIFPYLTPAAVPAAIRTYNEIIRMVAYRYGAYFLDSAERGKSRISPAKGVFLDNEGALQVAQGFLTVTRSMGLHKREQQYQQPRQGSIL